MGDDIAWLRRSDGRLFNPEAGFWRVPHEHHDQFNAYQMIRRDGIPTWHYGDNEPWWEAAGTPVIDWQGPRPYRPGSGSAAHQRTLHRSGEAQPRLAAPAGIPEGVPISALVFGGRRRELAPLVYEAPSWPHGVLSAAAVASRPRRRWEVGVVRRDPMASFAGYNR